MTIVAEGIGVLKLIKEILQKTAYLNLGKIVAYSDVKWIKNRVNHKIKKENQYT